MEAGKLQSAALYQAHKAKLDRYALHGAIVERQTLDGLRSLSPMILPVAVSSHYMESFALVHVAWLTEKYYARLLLRATATTACRQTI